MLPASVLALQVLLILLPGFAASALVEALAIRGKQSDFQRVIGAALYSFLIYSLYVLKSGGALPFRINQPGSVTWIKMGVGWLLAITLFVSLLSTIYSNFDGNRLLRTRWFSLTERTTRHSVWNDVFERVAIRQQIVQVEMDDARSIIGVLTYYSDDAEDCSLFLSQASWVAEDGQTISVPGAGILLTKNAGIKNVSLLNKP